MPHFKLRKTRIPEKLPKAPDEQLEKDGYQEYLENENIYNKFDKEFDIDPENSAKNKDIIQIEKNPTWNEKNFNQDQFVNCTKSFCQMCFFSI